MKLWYECTIQYHVSKVISYCNRYGDDPLLNFKFLPRSCFECELGQRRENNTHTRPHEESEKHPVTLNCEGLKPVHRVTTGLRSTPSTRKRLHCHFNTQALNSCLLWTTGQTHTGGKASQSAAQSRNDSRKENTPHLNVLENFCLDSVNQFSNCYSFCNGGFLYVCVSFFQIFFLNELAPQFILCRDLFSFYLKHHQTPRCSVSSATNPKATHTVYWEHRGGWKLTHTRCCCFVWFYSCLKK